jgi:hypothetical protein
VFAVVVLIIVDAAEVLHRPLFYESLLIRRSIRPENFYDFAIRESFERREMLADIRQVCSIKPPLTPVPKW